jgi:hypothetical protein
MMGSNNPIPLVGGVSGRLELSLLKVRPNLWYSSYSIVPQKTYKTKTKTRRRNFEVSLEAFPLSLTSPL